MKIYLFFKPNFLCVYLFHQHFKIYAIEFSSNIFIYKLAHNLWITKFYKRVFFLFLRINFCALYDITRPFFLSSYHVRISFPMLARYTATSRYSFHYSFFLKSGPRYRAEKTLTSSPGFEPGSPYAKTSMLPTLTPWLIFSFQKYDSSHRAGYELHYVTSHSHVLPWWGSRVHNSLQFGRGRESLSWDQIW